MLQQYFWAETAHSLGQKPKTTGAGDTPCSCLSPCSQCRSFHLCWICVESKHTHFSRRLDSFQQDCSNDDGAQQQTEGQLPDYRPRLTKPTGSLQDHLTEWKERRLRDVYSIRFSSIMEIRNSDSVLVLCSRIYMLHSYSQYCSVRLVVMLEVVQERFSLVQLDTDMLVTLTATRGGRDGRQMSEWGFQLQLKCCSYLQSIHNMYMFHTYRYINKGVIWRRI